MENITLENETQQRAVYDSTTPRPRLNLALLGKGQDVSAQHLENIARFTPRPSGRWNPLAFACVVDSLRDAVNDAGFSILQEKHKLARFNDETPLGGHYFGMFEISGLGGRDDIRTVIGLRQSHDKTLAASICAGDAPLVCSNLCFYNEFVMRRKNTINAAAGLAQNMADILRRVGESKAGREAHIKRLEERELTDNQAHVLSARAYRAGAIGATGLAKVVDQWHEPEHEEFKPRNAWSLHNAFTNVWRSTPHQTADRTAALHGVLNAVL